MTTVPEKTSVSLTDVWNAVKQHRLQLLVAVVVATVLSYAVASFVPEQWEASVLMQVGQVGQVAQMGQGGVIGQQQLLETPGNLVPRMMQPSFLVGLKDQIRASGIQLSDGDAKLLKDSFRAVQAKNSDLVEAKLRAYSADLAKSQIQNCIAYVRVAQAESYETGVARLRGQKEAASRDIQATRALLKVLDKQLRETRNVNERLFAGMLLQSKNDELRNLEQAERLLQEQLSPARTYQTRTFGDVYVSEEPVSPKKGWIAAVAFLLTLVAGVVVATLWHTRAPAKSQAN